MNTKQKTNTILVVSTIAMIYSVLSFGASLLTVSQTQKPQTSFTKEVINKNIAIQGEDPIYRDYQLNIKNSNYVIAYEFDTTNAGYNYSIFNKTTEEAFAVCEPKGNNTVDCYEFNDQMSRKYIGSINEDDASIVNILTNAISL